MGAGAAGQGAARIGNAGLAQAKAPPQFRIVQHGKVALRLNAPLAHHNNPVYHVSQPVEPVVNHQNRHAALLEKGQLEGQLGRGFRIKVGCGFVQHKGLRALGPQGGKTDLLLLAFRKLMYG